MAMGFSSFQTSHLRPCPSYFSLLRACPLSSSSSRSLWTPSVSRRVLDCKPEVYVGRLRGVQAAKSYNTLTSEGKSNDSRYAWRAAVTRLRKEKQEVESSYRSKTYSEGNIKTITPEKVDNSSYEMGEVTLYETHGEGSNVDRVNGYAHDNPDVVASVGIDNPSVEKVNGYAHDGPRLGVATPPRSGKEVKSKGPLLGKTSKFRKGIDSGHSKVEAGNVMNRDKSDVKSSESKAATPVHSKEDLRKTLNNIYDKVLIVNSVSIAKKVVRMLRGEYRHLVHACDTEVSCMIMKLSNHFGGRYVALMKLILPGDGHLTSHGRIRCWKSRTDSQKMEELHACESLLVIFSNLLGKQSSEFHASSTQDIDRFGVFEWEKSIITSQKCLTESS